jgi:predicted metal-binding protein
MTDDAGARVMLHVCITCRRGDEPLEPKEGRSGAKMRFALSDELKRHAGGIDLLPVECLSGCKRGCTVAVAAQGKWTYVLADLDPAVHAPDVLKFAAQYRAHPEGLPIWRDRPEIVKRSVLARVPPFEVHREEEAAA